MMSLLLESTWAQQASDFITAKWAELLGILGGTAGISIILGCVSRILVMLVKAKIDKKTTAPIFTKFAELENKFLELKETFFEQAKLMFGEQMQGYILEFEKKFDEKFAQYQAKKQEICDKIVGKTQEIEQAIAETEELEQDLTVVVEETKEEVKEIVATEEQNVSCETISETPQTIKVKKTYAN